MTSNGRPTTLQSFLDAVHASFRRRSTDAKTIECLDRVFEALEAPAPFNPSPPTRVDTSKLLNEALEPARQGEEDLAQLARRILDIDPQLTWRRRAGAAPQASASFLEEHANAMVVGPKGLEERHDVWVGLSLLGPGVRYPDHRHSPEEIYLVLTDGKFQQANREWFTPGVGGTFYNEPNIVHAMAASPVAPMLAVWCLFDNGRRTAGTTSA